MHRITIYCLGFLFGLIIQISSGFGQNIKASGEEFLKSHFIRPSDFPIGFEFIRETKSGNYIILESDDPACFIVYQQDKGVLKIAAYSTQNTFSREDIYQPAAMMLLSALEHQAPSKKNKKSGFLNTKIPIGPLLKTKWNQDNWFNRYCPYNIKCNAGENVYAGCVAVAMGQVIRYYGKWNNFILDANHSYNNDLLSAYATGYNWPEMINYPLSYDLEICRMLSDMGILIKMNYGYQTSSQGTGRARIGFNELGFDNAYKIEQHHFDQEGWLGMIYASLGKYTPIFVAGKGHAFVCDGYDEDGRLHFNLGWGGIGDGFYDHNSIRGKYSANEAIFEVIPDSDFEAPHSLRVEQINNFSSILWSPPYQWGTPSGYRVYYSDEDFFSVQDTIVQIDNLQPGTHGIMVSALYPNGESIWIGPIWIYSKGDDITITDPAIHRALSVDIEIDLLQSSITIEKGKLADLRTIAIKDSLESVNIFSAMYRLQELELNGAGLRKEDLGFITSLNQLQSLKLSNFNCDNLPHFHEYSKLVQLKLDSCKIKDLNFLSGLKYLVILE